MYGYFFGFPFPVLVFTSSINPNSKTCYGSSLIKTMEPVGAPNEILGSIISKSISRAMTLYARVTTVNEFRAAAIENE